MANEHILRGEAPPRVSLIYNPVVRGIVFQIVVFASLFAFIVWIVNNTQENLQRIGRTISFGFLNERAGFDIGEAPAWYSSDRTYWDAYTIGFINTLRVVIAGLVFLMGVTIRHFFNTMHASGDRLWWTWAATTIMFIMPMWPSTAPM